MAIPTAGKVALWVVGGFFALGCGGVIFLYGAASLAMWKNSTAMEKETAQREAAYKAMTPTQHLAMAQDALDHGDPSICLAYLKSVPEGTPGRAELLEQATRKQKAQDDARAAMEAMTPEEHLAKAKAALEAGDVPGCRGHLYYVPRTTPGCEDLMAAASAKERLLESQEHP